MTLCVSVECNEARGWQASPVSKAGPEKRLCISMQPGNPPSDCLIAQTLKLVPLLSGDPLAQLDIYIANSKSGILATSRPNTICPLLIA